MRVTVLIRRHEFVVALRFILDLLIATSGLLLLYQQLGTRQSEDSTGSVASSQWGVAFKI
jgi:hypothetical protein